MELENGAIVGGRKAHFEDLDDENDKLMDENISSDLPTNALPMSGCMEDSQILQSSGMPSITDNPTCMKKLGNEQPEDVIQQTEIVKDYISTDVEMSQLQESDTPSADCKFEPKLYPVCSYKCDEGNFFKGCKWAPDGLCLMTCNEDNIVRLLNAPKDVLEQKWTTAPETSQFTPCLSIKEAEIIYDFTWWPFMNSMYPETCCFATTAKDQPIHLWDAFNGDLRASYIAKNNVDEVTSAYSLAFSPDGMQLVSGFAKQLRLFYIDKPGASCEVWPLRKHKKASGQRSIISACQFNPDGATIACGSYDGTIGLYSSKNGDLVSLLDCKSRGITQVQFSPDGNRLYAGSRMGGEIVCWDMRTSFQPLFHLERQVETNQRIYFDISSTLGFKKDMSKENLIISGGTDGLVSMWDVSKLISNHDVGEVDPSLCKYEHHAQKDCINGASLHPFLPVLATSSGQRHFKNFLLDDSDSESGFSDDEIESNCVQLWHIKYSNIANETV